MPTTESNPDGSAPVKLELDSSEEACGEVGVQISKPVEYDVIMAEIGNSEDTNQEIRDESALVKLELDSSGEGHQEISVRNLHPDGSDFRMAEVGISVEKNNGTDLKNPSCPNGLDSNVDEAQLENGSRSRSDCGGVEFVVLGVSMVEEMEKVSLVGDYGGISVVADMANGKEGDGLATTVKLKEGVKPMEDGNGVSGDTLADIGVKVVSHGIEKSATESVVAESNKDERDNDVSESNDCSKSSSSSSEEEDETDVDVDDSDDDSDHKDEEKMEIGEMEEGEIRDLDREVMGSSSGDEEEGMVAKGPIKSKSELEVLPPVPPVDVVLEPHHQILPVGVILAMMGTKVIVEGVEKHNPLNEGSILWVTETRSPLGLIDEIFGPVKNPYYIVRYNSEEDIPDGIREGTAVSFVAEFANHVLNDKTLYKKGYDASGDNDEEISDEAEFSDDEKEAEYRKMQRMAKRGKGDQKQGNREFDGLKKFQNKGKFRNNVQASSPSPVSLGPAGPHDSGMKSQEFNGRKKFQGKGKFRNNVHAPVPPSPVSLGPAGPMGGGLQSAPSQGPPLPGTFGCGGCGCSHSAEQVGDGSLPMPYMAQPVGFHGGAPHHMFLQSNAVWSNGIPLPQQHMGLANGFPMNGMPQQQQQHMGLVNGLPMNAVPHQQQPDQFHQQHQHQMFMGYPNGMPCQPQFNPGQMPPPTMAPPFGNLGVGAMPTPLVGGPGLGCFNQMPFGMNGSQNIHPCSGMGEQGLGDSSMGQLPPSGHGGVSAPQQFSLGMASNRERRQYPRGGRGKFFGGRSYQQTKQ